MADLVGQTILHYRIIEHVGQGGMGVVYKAEDTKLKRDVAIKFLPPQIASGEEERQRFRNEAQAAAGLNHPNIATIYAIEEVDDEIFIVMEYIEGRELKETISSEHLSVNEVVDIAIQIGEGLKVAHERGIVHRDIKSSNIMITPKGQVKIMDFGLARVHGGPQLTKDNTTLGTAPYMSPEQTRGEPVDHRADIWSFGVVIYEMLTGQHPFKGGYEQAVIYSIMNEEADYPDSVPENLKKVLQRALSKNLDERYQHIDEVVNDLRGNTEDRKPDGPTNGKRRQNSHYVGYILSGIGLVIVIFAVWFFGPLYSGSQTIDSIAVLPLDNLSGDPAQDYFSDGMTEALITDLSKISALKVISRTSVMHFKDSKKTLPEIARELGVKAVIEGSVLRDGDRVRITAQLIEAESDRNLWADSYERDLTDIFSLQRDIAQAIAMQVRATLTPDEQRRFQDVEQIDPRAYEAYLKGIHHVAQYNPSDFLKGLDYFTQAVEIEPDFALGYVGIVSACLGLIDIGGLSYGETYPRAKSALDKALELNNALAEAYRVQGEFKSMAEWDWAGAEKAFRHSLELNPNLATTYHAYSIFLIAMDRREEARSMITKARTLDPLNAVINSDVAWINFCARRYDTAIREYKNNLEMYPDFIMSHRELAWPYAKKSMLSEAIQSTQRAIELERSAYNRAQLAMVYARAGQKDKAHQILSELLQTRQTEHLAAYEFAMIYTALGDFDEAFNWLEKSYHEHSGWPFFIKADPLAEELHSDPRYGPFLRRMGLEP